jgi:bifunctional UDP-N-acetylglucosamine pyrophosphorylase/glucosamine-1-phosphate N-acetyltransferase
MTAHVIRACREAGAERIVVIVGHEAEAVRAGLGSSVEYALQEQQRGTGHAVRSAHHLLADWPGNILIVAGDVPLIRSETLRRLLDSHHASGVRGSMLTATLDDPTGYGRVIRDADGSVARIVEERDANVQEKAVKEWNPSIYVFDAAALWPSLAELKPNNAQGEYYLTDVVGLLVGSGQRVEAVAAESSVEVFGVNTRVELANVAERLRRRILDRLMLSGVTITDPATTYVDVDVEVGQDTVLEPSTFLTGSVRIGEDCKIGPHARIADSVIADRVHILASQVVGSHLDDDVRVGPFSNLRAGTHLCTKVKIGDFVEVKNSILHPGAQASHLAYLGDAEIGEKTNVGAGVITCNYDGYSKHKTSIGSGVFVGSNSTLVAPVSIGDRSFIAAASAVTMDVPENAMIIARSHPTVKEGWSARYHEKQRTLKQAAQEKKE